MAYKYTHFIKQNTAPQGAKQIGVYDDKGNRVFGIPLGNLSFSNVGEKLYSFGLLSDLHVDGIGMNGTYLSEAMTFFENQGCAFCCHAGDITNIGFWYNSTDTEMYLQQMAEFKSVIEAHPSLPMHGICGNHESYNKSIMDNLAELKVYTKRDLYYTYTHGNDAFIFIGQPSGTPYAFGKRQEWIKELQWLYETLEANRDKRCFVFEHLTLSDDSGNPNNIHNAYWGDLENTLVNVMKHYKNAMLFHGHSHLDFKEQVNFSYSNYSTKKGFKSISIPSSGGSRITVDGALQRVNKPELRSGYIVDVYENCVVLKGYYFQNFEVVPIAQYCIDTKLLNIEANTFKDSSGVITI